MTRRLFASPSASQVVVVKNFASRHLGNTRSLLIYLPRGYAQQRPRRYPVVYMQAGQRLFAPRQPDEESWRVDHTLDRLIAEHQLPELIVVGIAAKRDPLTTEYWHDFTFEQGCVPVGQLYERFVLEELMPYIEAHFRVRRGPAHTALIGSSAGAMISYHIGLAHPEVFGHVGMLSPMLVFRTPAGEQRLYRSPNVGGPQCIYLDGGIYEGDYLVRYLREFVTQLIGAGYTPGERLFYYLDPQGGHTEKDWCQRVALPLLCFFGKPARPLLAELHGRRQVGLNEREAHLNAVLRYASGLRLSDLTGAYYASSPHLSVAQDGTLRPAQVGSATVQYRKLGCDSALDCQVVAYQNPLVKVSLDVTVPLEGGPQAELQLNHGLVLTRVGPRRFWGEFWLPRDYGCEFRFSAGFRSFELDGAGRVQGFRRFLAERDLQLSYEVARWPQNTAERGFG